MPSARAFANIKHIEQAFGWIKTSRGARVGRWRIVEMEVTATSSIMSKRGVSPSRASFWGKSDGESPFGALKGFLDMRYRSACAEFSSC
jgi:hypothetical protein